MSDHVENIEEKKPKKRGRKPGSKNKNYFGLEEEQAFQEYLSSSDSEYRERIFNRQLKPAFTKMIESIIRRYNLFTPYEDFDDTFNDTLSFMATKVGNFKPGKGKKAYSYCGTICKNYLINKRQTTAKHNNKFLSYNTVYTEANPDNRVEHVSTFHDSFNKNLICNVVNDIIDTVEEGVWDDGSKINENEKKVGYAIVELLSNWENIFKTDCNDKNALTGSQKFNKSSLLYYIQDNTMLKSKEVKCALKKFKINYQNVKDRYLKNF